MYIISIFGWIVV